MPNVQQIAKSLLLHPKRYSTNNYIAKQLTAKGCSKLRFNDLFETENHLLIYQSLISDRDKLLSHLKLHPQDPEHKNVFYASQILSTPLPSLLSFAYHPKIQIIANTLKSHFSCIQAIFDSQPVGSHPLTTVA